jgi:hypothetical protein
MTENDRPDPDDVHFVVGSAAAGRDDELLDTGPPRHTDRRLVIGLAVAALAIGGLVVGLGGNAPTHTTSTPSGSHSVSPSAPAPPTFSNIAPSDEVTVTPVALPADLCPPRPGCFHIPTPARAQAEIRAAIRQAFGGLTQLRIRNSAVALDDPPRRLLFARGIDATTPLGTIHVVAAAVGENSYLTVRIGVNGITTQTMTGEYTVSGSVNAAKGMNPLSLGDRLNRLVGDGRLVAQS